MSDCFRDVLEALGSSLISEELKGDLSKASVAADQCVASAEEDADPKAVVDALLYLAIVQTLQGLPGKALQTLSKTGQPEAFTSDQRARYAAYRHLAVQARFNTLPGGEGANGAQAKATWDGKSYAMEEAERWKRIPLDECRRDIARESLLLHDTLCNLKSVRTFCGPAPWLDERKKEEYLTVAIQAPLGLIQLRQDDRADPVVAFGYYSAADICRRAGRTDAMGEFLQEAIIRYDEVGDQVGAGLCFQMFGDSLASPFTNPVYRNLLVQDTEDVSSDISPEMEDLERRTPLPNPEAARTAYGEARERYTFAGARRGLAALDLRESYLETLAGDPHEATRLAQLASDAFDSTGDVLHGNLARIHLLLNRILTDPFFLDEGLCREVGEWGRSGGSFSWALGLGLLLGSTGRFWLRHHADHDRAVSCFRNGEVLFQALGAPINRAQAVADQALVHGALGEAKTNLSLSGKAFDLYRESVPTVSGSPEVVQDLRNRLLRLLDSIFWMQAGQEDSDGMALTAKRLQEQLLTLEHPAGRGAGPVDEDESRSLITKQARSTLELSSVLVPLYKAKAFSRQGLFDDAEPHFQEALEQAPQLSINNPHRWEGIVRGTMGDLEGAKKTYQLLFAEPGAFLDSVGRDAVENVRKLVPEAADKMMDRLFMNEHLNAMDFLVQMEAFGEAKRHLEAVEEKLGSRWWEEQVRPWESLARRAELSLGMGDPQVAIEDIDQGVMLLEGAWSSLRRDTQKTAAGSSQMGQHVYLIGARSSFEMRKRDPDREEYWVNRAYQFAERGKAQGLLDLISSPTGTPGHLKESSRIRAWREFNARLTTWHNLIAGERGQDRPSESRLKELNQNLCKDEEVLKSILAEVSVSHPGFHNLTQSRGQISAVEDVTPSLNPDTLLLQYYFRGGDFFAWALDRDGLLGASHERYDSREITRSLKAFHEACSRHGDWRHTGEAVARVFLEPFKTHLGRYPHLAIVPFGAAHRIPFHALPWEGDVLGKNHAVSYLPSGSILSYLEAPVPGIAGPILAIGDPANMSYLPTAGGAKVSAPPLPFARLEAQYVGAIHPGSKSLVASSAEEVRVRERIPRFPVLHFATHGILNEKAPLLSSLLMAEGESITVSELLGMEINSELVVLSACQTGLGEITGGDDVLGLTRSMLASGAKSLVVSYWSVRDAATSFLMRHFYGQLPEVGPAVGLQRAQEFIRKLSPEEVRVETEKLRAAVQREDPENRGPNGRGTRDLLPPKWEVPDKDRFAHPYYWAAFGYVGKVGG